MRLILTLLCFPDAVLQKFMAERERLEGEWADCRIEFRGYLAELRRDVVAALPPRVRRRYDQLFTDEAWRRFRRASPRGERRT